jgi:hypothetical protein
VDKSNLTRLFLAVILTFTFMGAAQAGQVKERDLSDAVAPQEESHPSASTSSNQSSQAGAADEAKDGFTSGGKGLGSGFKNGVVATGHGFVWLGGKMGSGLSTAGTTMGHGFKTAGVCIKNFFTGKYFGFGKKNDSVDAHDLRAKAGEEGQDKTDVEATHKKDDDLEMDVDSKKPHGNDDWKS